MNAVEKYISECPQQYIQQRLHEVRSAIIEIVGKEAEEKIAYGMPAYYNEYGYIIYFAAAKNHIGIYPLPKAIVHFQEDLKPYKQGKGSVQFPHNQPLPIGLIKKIAAFKLDENTKKQN